MKAEFIIPPEFVSVVAQEVAAALKPLLAAREKEPDAILSPDQLAALLGVPKGWIYERVSLGEIPHFKAGKYLRFRRSAIEKWIESQSTPASGPPNKRVRVGQVSGGTAD